MRRTLLVALLALCLVPASSAQAAPRLTLFPTPLVPLTNTPPFPPPDTALPNLFRSPIRSSEQIAVDVDERGRVVTVHATQRLVLKQTADYRLTVPAPVKDVVAGPGSQSTPGLRTGAILWAGFAAGHKVLTATATLDAGTAAATLPLRVVVTDGAVRLENTTATTASTYKADGDRGQLAQILDALRTDPAGRKLGQGTYVKVRGAAQNARVRVSAPLEVRGRIAGRRIALVLGGGEPGARTFQVRGRVSIDLSVEPVSPAVLVRPPRGDNWAEAIRVDPALTGRVMFDRAVRASLTLARVRQYDQLLANPDSFGPISARYDYRTVATPSPVPPPSPEHEGIAAWLLALIVAGSVAAAGGLAVVWAHS